MVATIVNETADSLTLQVVIKFNRSMLEAENAIIDTLNEAGTLASANFLKRFDTDGSPIVIGQTKLTTGCGFFSLDEFVWKPLYA